MERRPSKPVNTGEWLNTYADMITLVLCFFVLLYSMSSVDQEKWENFAATFSETAAAELEAKLAAAAEAAQQGAVPGSDQPVTGGEKTFDNLLEAIQKAIGENQLENQMTAYGGTGVVLVQFEDTVLFDGDRFELKPAAIATLDSFAGVLQGMDDEISEVHVFGHTTRVSPDRPNDYRIDAILSGSRSAMVASYLQDKEIIAPKKILHTGAGQEYPISPIDTEENRSKNRRVEIVITKTGNPALDLDSIYEEAGIKILH